MMGKVIRAAAIVLLIISAAVLIWVILSLT
ncbi:hypothetical protein DEU52_1426 [Ensifer adhaerens]|nr:hypothetical protein DEU52_1426 [Ensifer adhaerens]